MRKRTREAAGLREGPASAMTLSSSSSPPRSIVPVARVRTPGIGSGNVPLSKQLITSYGYKKYTPEEERKSVGLQDLPWGQLSVDALPVLSISGSSDIRPIPPIDVNDRAQFSRVAREQAKMVAFLRI
ncbi:hypothetical protein ACH5RR_006867 [Cinchona calisaya]|uniref:Uncharacterized protein n=1 Tax=Cinchona calisaya TaxID=153742 RepID=A0ABD3AQJ8_9GENT